MHLVYSSHGKCGRSSRELSREEFSEFKSILLFYIDFCQKQKVTEFFVYTSHFIQLMYWSLLLSKHTGHENSEKGR